MSFKIGERVSADISVAQPTGPNRIYYNKTGKIIEVRDNSLVQIRFDEPIDAGTEREIRTVYAKARNCVYCLKGEA